MLHFQRPNRCDNSGPNCVEVAADQAGNRLIRDSKNPQGPVLSFTDEEWQAFEASVRAGQRF